MGEYSYRLHVRFGTASGSGLFTIDCVGFGVMKGLMKCLKSFPGVLPIAVDRLEAETS